MAIKRYAGAKGKCDVLASKITRSKGFCEHCGSTDNLQTSHVVSRRYSATRTDLSNLQCLCAKCHFYYTSWPKEFSRWITSSLGVEKYEQLKAKAEAVTKVDWEMELIRLKDIAKEME